MTDRDPDAWRVTVGRLDVAPGVTRVTVKTGGGRHRPPTEVRLTPIMARKLVADLLVALAEIENESAW
jgi:hypothetical protein